MDISPAPVQPQASLHSRLATASQLQPPPPPPAFERVAAQPTAAAPPAEYPFLRNLFQSRPRPIASISTSSLPTVAPATTLEQPDNFLLAAPTAPLSLKARREGRPSLQHAASTGSLGLKPPFELRGMLSKSSLKEAESFVEEPSHDGCEDDEGPMEPPKVTSCGLSPS